MPAPEKHTTAPAPDLSTAQAIELLAERLKPQGAQEDLRRRLEKDQEPKRWRLIPWRSELTGATALAHVVESNTHKNGRITKFIDYTRPSAAYVYVKHGGMVPDDRPIWHENKVQDLHEGREPADGAIDQAHKHWMWQTFYQADLRTYIEREILSHHCTSPEGLSAPWKDGRVSAHLG